MGQAQDRRADGELDTARSAIAAAKFADEADLVGSLLDDTPYDASRASSIEREAVKIVARARADDANRPILDTFLTQYGLSNKEGIALMCLAESLLRVPDQRTAELLIADKIKFGDWASHTGASESLLVNASTWALLLGSKLVEVDREFTADPGKWIGKLATRLTQPVIETAMRSAMRILGREFVLGTTIERALDNSDVAACYSYDMLGEAARDAATAERYLEAYLHAIETVGRRERTHVAPPSISIKLSALHPRYEASQRHRVLEELVPIVKQLCLAAENAGLDLAIDAEEADRLELSLDVFERIARDPDLKGFKGIGLVVQAYGKRARPVLHWLIALARETGRRFPVRLVKGAYWDAEIKHAQVHGYPGFPIFTRKPSTDLSYLVCTRLILDHPGELFGQFATHNAHTVAAVMALANERGASFEFQRLHGMGETLYAAAREVFDNFPNLRTYAPVGSHDDLLAYLVRRLLENGANSSFVNRFLNDELDPRELVRDPVAVAAGFDPVAHQGIATPNDLFLPTRKNSSGIDLTDLAQVEALDEANARMRAQDFNATALVGGESANGSATDVTNPANAQEIVGTWTDQGDADVDRALTLASEAQVDWNARGGAARAELLEAFADRLEADRDRLMALLAREAGKTVQDAVDEVREAVDFCRYYAAQARERFEAPIVLPGPTGESNELYLEGRGVFVCISPWNFPLAIFVGQIVAALAAGNTVVAKPAEETPLIAYEAVGHLHAAGVPGNVCHLVLGAGAVGAQLVGHPLTAGVAFTGSTETAHKINVGMAAADRPIAPLIAETGGQNAMIVDSTALLEQVTDDAVHSAFYSAGQRCSALRVLYLQDDIADEAIALIEGAMDELAVGDPADISTDVGPIISDPAARSLEQHVQTLAERGCLLHRTKLAAGCANGSFVAPALLEIDSIDVLEKENFGPVLHLVRFDDEDFDAVLESIKGTGFGLTFGIHTRIESRIAEAAQVAGAGNVYANRNMTGAVVGVQPFGGRGHSGTGPKAGGPNYLLRFATERVVTINTVATGGNAELLSL